MMHTCVALTALTDRVRTDELATVATALQIQITRDFAPEWGAGAVVGAVPFETIPAGFIPIVVQDTLETVGVNGFHRTRNDDTPYIVVPYGPSWSLTASHELLRMLADPSGSARCPGPSRMPGQGTVEYVVDVSAPCQDIATAYAINGVTVSDFCTKAFFGAHGDSYSFTGAIQDPFEPAANGVVTWLADDGLLYQARASHNGRVRVHGGFSTANRALMLFRERVDSLTPDRPSMLSNAPRTNRLLEAEQNARRAGMSNATRFREDIAWRFGHASVKPAEAARPENPRRLTAYATNGARSGQQRASGEVERTVRTAS